MRGRGARSMRNPIGAALAIVAATFAAAVVAQPATARASDGAIDAAADRTTDPATDPACDAASDLAADERALAAAVREIDEQEASRPGTPRFEGLADQVWDIAGRRLCALLERVPRARAKDLEQVVADLDAGADAEPYYGLHATAVPLAGGAAPAWAVALNWYYSGTIIVLARDPQAGWVVGWRLRDFLKTDGRADDPAFVRWARYSEGGFHDGPFAGRVLALRPTRDGRARFAVDAQAQPDMGVLHPAQVSVWEWTGREARPVFVGWYEMGAADTGVTLDREGLRVRGVQPFASTFSCGSCDEAPLETWRIAVTPDGVEDRGRVPDVAGLALVDAVGDRVCHGRDASDLASPAAVGALAAWYEWWKREVPAVGDSHGDGGGDAGDNDEDGGGDRARDDDALCFGMLGTWSSEKTPTGLRVRLTADALGVAVFEITGQGAAARVTRVTFPFEDHQ